MVNEINKKTILESASGRPSAYQHRMNDIAKYSGMH